MPTGSASAAGERMLGASAWHASFVYHVLAVTSVQYVRPSMSDDGLACKVPICQCSAALYVRDHAVIFHGEHSKDPIFLLPVIREVPNDVHTFTSHECCIRPPQTAVWRHSGPRAHARPTGHVQIRDVTGLGGRAHVRPQSEPHKGACVSGAPAPTCWAPAPPRAPHPHTYCDRVPRQQPANRAAATARNRRRGAATTAGGAAAPSLAHCPAAEWQPRRLRCLRRPSRGTCEQGEDAVGRLGGRRVAACHRGGRTREGTRRRQRRRPRSRTAAQVCAACAACPSPPPC
jgi:hypothetical protein